MWGKEGQDKGKESDKRKILRRFKFSYSRQERERRTGITAVGQMTNDCSHS